jgi:hypothetical protein
MLGNKRQPLPAATSVLRDHAVHDSPHPVRRELQVPGERLVGRKNLNRFNMKP